MQLRRLLVTMLSRQRDMEADVLYGQVNSKEFAIFGVYPENGRSGSRPEFYFVANGSDPYLDRIRKVAWRGSVVDVSVDFIWNVIKEDESLFAAKQGTEAYQIIDAQFRQACREIFAAAKV